MGLLDEAIRDHLDLKRRRGADPGELERAEREALGPVRRKGDVAAVDYEEPDALLDEDADQELASSGAAYDQADDEGWDYSDEPLAPETSLPDDEPESFSRGRRSRSVSDDDEHDAPRGLAARFGLRRSRDASEADDEVDADRDEPLGEEEPTRPHSTADQQIGPEFAQDREPDEPIEGETAEHDVLGASERDEDDDMLEETPEFLQDTPDHDRLWFEQRPPRDFDFDN